MSFLTHFEANNRNILEQASTSVELGPGEYLLRSNDVEDHLYLVADGELEVIDNRRTTAVHIASLTAGALIGKVALLTGTPRTTDVRAATACRLQCWRQDHLRDILKHHTELAVVFYREVAVLSTIQMGTVTQDALAGGLPDSRGPALTSVMNDARALAEVAKEGLIRAERALRADKPEHKVAQRLDLTLETLRTGLSDLCETYRDAASQREAGQLLVRELHPYLVRSTLAELCLHRTPGVSGLAEVFAHILVNKPGGDDALGQLLDAWLLQLPTLAAVRDVQGPISELVMENLPLDRRRRVLVVNAGTGAMVAKIVHKVAHHPTEIHIIDQSREALAFYDVGATHRPDMVELRTIQENLVRFAHGLGRHPLRAQDVIVLHGLLEYMPDRIGISLLETCRELLQVSGTIIATTVAPSRDDALLDRLLNLPTVRRTQQHTGRLLRAAQLRERWTRNVANPARIIAAGW